MRAPARALLYGNGSRGVDKEKGRRKFWSMNDELQIGDTVYHPIYGKGIVDALDIDDGRCDIHVAFEDCYKWLSDTMVTVDQ